VSRDKKEFLVKTVEAELEIRADLVLVRGYFGCIVAKTTEDIKLTRFIFCEDVRRLPSAFCTTSELVTMKLDGVIVAVGAQAACRATTETSCFTLNGPMV
jgi:hypothetical protein